MTNLITPHVYCPLCEGIMSFRGVMVGTKVATFYFCKPCHIGSYDFDPAFNKWRDADKTVPCPTCKNDMKWFIRYQDGYFKARCPKCKTQLEKDGDVKISKTGALELPDMEKDEPAEEPVKVWIPKSKLKNRRRK